MEFSMNRMRPRVFFGSFVIGVLMLGFTACSKPVPEIHGRVVDAETGEPIAGAEVGRHMIVNTFTLHGPPGGGDLGTLVRTQTGDDGRFVLPGMTIKRPSGLAWHVFKPGWMEAQGCWIDRERWGIGACWGWENNIFRENLLYQPWATAEATFDDGGLQLEVALYRPECTSVPGLGTSDPNDSIPTKARNQEDAWPEYFRRILSLVKSGILEWEVYLDEEAKYVETGGELCDRMLWDNLNVIGDGEYEDSWWADHRRVTVARAVVDYCDQNPAGEYCSRRVEYIERLRDRVYGPQVVSQGNES